MEITTEILARAEEMVTGLMDDHHREIDEAFMNTSEQLSIDLKAKFAPDKNGIKISASISFTKERCKNSISVVMDPRQKSLFGLEGGIR